MSDKPTESKSPTTSSTSLDSGNINKSNTTTSSSTGTVEEKKVQLSAKEALAELGIFVDENDELLAGLHDGKTNNNDDNKMDLEEKKSSKSIQSNTTEDIYSTLKSLQRQLEFINIQSEYIRDEQKNLKRELLRARDEIKRIQSVPLVIGQFLEMIDQNTGIVSSTTGHIYYVRILSTINRELLKTNSSVALHRYSNSVVDVLPPEADSAITMMQMQEKPDVTYADIGGNYIIFITNATIR